MRRRNFLRGMVGGSAVALSLPWLESTARADGGFPARMVIWVWGNGNRPNQWTPAGEGESYALSESLMPLALLKDDITVVTGLTVAQPNNVPHWSGLGGMLTGSEVDGNDQDWIVRGPTIDQIAAQEIGGETIFRSLQVGIATEECFSWNGPNAQNPAEMDPFALYERLFGPTFVEPGSGGVADPRLGFRRSALDAVTADLTGLMSSVSSHDRIRLEQHFDGVRDLELRLARLQEDPPDYEACTSPEVPLPAYPDIDGRPQLAARNAVQSELVAMALACDQTRVANIQYSRAVSNLLFPDASDGHHNQTHNEPGEQPEVGEITRFVMEGFATFLEALKAIPEGDGTLLDHSLVLATSDVSEGRTHSLDEMPVVLAGSACGRIVQGQHIRYERRNSNDLGLSMLRALGVTTASFGSGDSVATDGLAEIEI